MLHITYIDQIFNSNSSDSKMKVKQALETFTVNDGRTRFVVFLLGNPHLLEGGQ